MSNGYSPRIVPGVAGPARVRVRRPGPRLAFSGQGQLSPEAPERTYRPGRARTTPCWPYVASGSLLIRDVEVQAVACRNRVHQGLQLRGRGPVRPCLPPALQRDPGGKPGAYRAQRPRPGRRRRGDGGVRPPLSAAGLRPRRRSLAWRGGLAQPGSPAEAERAGDQHLVAADGDVGADLEVGPAQLVLDLFVALLGPVPGAVDPHDLLKARGRMRAACLARAAGAGQVGGQVPGGLVRQGARAGG